MSLGIYRGMTGSCCERPGDWPRPPKNHLPNRRLFQAWSPRRAGPERDERAPMLVMAQTRASALPRSLAFLQSLGGITSRRKDSARALAQTKLCNRRAAELRLSANTYGSVCSAWRPSAREPRDHDRMTTKGWGAGQASMEIARS